MTSTEPAPVDLMDTRRLRADRARQVADVLRRQLRHGAFPGGEPRLVKEFRTSRNTVRDALDLLRDEGLIERCPGVGTTLVRDLGVLLLAEDLEHNDIFVLIERLSGQRLGEAELTVEAVNADPHSAATLDAPRGAALLMVERLTHLADGRPVDLEFIRFRDDRLAMRGTLHRHALSGAPHALE